MHSPFGRPMADEPHVCLGSGRPGAAAHDYYLFGNGEVWCLEYSPTNMHCSEWWAAVRGNDLGRVLADGKTVAQLVAENAGGLSARPSDTSGRPAAAGGT